MGQDGVALAIYVNKSEVMTVLQVGWGIATEEDPVVYNLARLQRSKEDKGMRMT